jgi:very-short-patch-repair endonuclease
MFTGVFRDRSRSVAFKGGSAQETLARLLTTKSLKQYRFIRHCAIGPFVVDHFCREHALVVELQRSQETEARHQARAMLLNEMGYSVLQVAGRDVLCRPDQVLAQLRAALR